MKKELKELYGAKKKPQLLDVPSLNFVMIDGTGDPNHNERFQAAINILYGLSYTIKFDLKKAKVGPEYTVMPLEGLWWLKGGREFEMGERDEWIWTLMIAQPEHIMEEYYLAAKEKVIRKDPSLPVQESRFETFTEGRCAQILHIGSYATEPESIKIMHDFMTKEGLRQCGKHHEIYMSDPRRTSPEKLRTIIRHPVCPI